LITATTSAQFNGYRITSSSSAQLNGYRITSWASRRRLDAFLDRWATLNIEMDEDAKVHWAETVDKPATVNSRFPGTLGSLVERQKISV
jgi:hypothetical protein